MSLNAQKSKDILVIVNEADQPTGEASRRAVHQKALLHREVYGYVISPRRGALLQLRRQGNIWDHSVSGHCAPDESYVETAIRKYREELGVHASVDELETIGYTRLSSLHTSKKNDRFVSVFALWEDIMLTSFALNRDEVLAVRYHDIPALERALNGRQFTESSKHVLREYVIPAIKNKK